MSAMDVFAGICLLIVGWTGYNLGVASERERAARRAQAAADRAAARRAADSNVVDLNARRGRAS